MAAKSGVNDDSLHSLLVLGRPLVTRTGLAPVDRGHGFGVLLDVRDSEVFDQVLVNEYRPQLTNPGKLSTTKGSIEPGGSFSEEIDPIGWGHRHFTPGAGGDESTHSRRRVLKVIRRRLGGMGSAVLSRRSHIRDWGTGHIPFEKTWCEEVQVQNTT